MRLAEIATKLASFEAMEGDALHNVLRGPAIKVLFAAQPGRGRTSAAEYAPEEIARARLLLAARDCGLTGPELANFNNALNQPPSAPGNAPDSAKVAGGGSNYPTGLRTVIRGARAGEEWYLRVRFTLTADGARRVAVSVEWEGWEVSLQPTNRATAALDEYYSEIPRGLLIIPASDLIRPLLDLIPEGE
ncbi:MAG: hypothetical protein GYB50_21275 [Rhodobacteraceae bacterium]|nr:hypothetical protein [Paracoccaceae bacterium]